MSIKRKLWLIAIMSISALFICGMFVAYTFGRVDDIDKLEENVSDLNVIMLKLRQAETNFVLHDLTKTELYETGVSENLNNFNTYIGEKEDILHDISESSVVHNYGLGRNLSKLSANLEQYNAVFQQYVQKYKERGFKDYGVEGEMRQSVHKLEEAFSASGIGKELILSMRRHEKDFIIRKDLEYQIKLHKTASELRGKIAESSALSATQKNEMNETVSDYQKSFNNLVDAEKAIGLDNKSGMKYKLNIEIERITPELAFVVSDIQEKAHTDVSRLFIMLVIVVLIFAAGMVAAILYLSRTITDSINTGKNAVQAIARGDFSQELGDATQDEIGELIANIETVRKVFADYEQELGKLVVFASKGELSERCSTGRFKGKYKEILDQINSLLDTILNPINGAIERIDEMSVGRKTHHISGNYGGEVKKLIAGVNEMIKVNDDITSKALSIANGDLTIELIKRCPDDQIISAFQQMIDALTHVLEECNMLANAVAEGSGEVSSSSASIAQGASEQASSVEEISSSMEEMVSTINQNTDNALATEKISTQAANDILEGEKAANVTEASMEQIASKISVVGEIAEKTDLLAINAAIEAARAGESGKGFAIVASEVRSLAEKSQSAAAVIGSVSAESVEVAKKSKQLLKELSPRIMQTASLIKEIASASMEQNSGVGQINSAIQQLASVTEQNSAASEELSANARELAQQANDMKAAISFFKFKSRSDESNTVKSVKKIHKIEFGNTANDNPNKGLKLKLSSDDRDFEPM